MTGPVGGPTLSLLLDERTTRSLVSVLTDLTGFFDNASPAVADAINDHFGDLAAADWVPIVLAEHAQALIAALDTASGIDRPGQERPCRPR
jgi:hypothetical protein